MHTCAGRGGVFVVGRRRVVVEAEQRNARPEDGEGAEDSDQHRTEAQEEEALREQPRVEPPAQQQPSDRQPERALAYGEGIFVGGTVFSTVW